jgi:hypothetical protein
LEKSLSQNVKCTGPESNMALHSNSCATPCPLRISQQRTPGHYTLIHVLHHFILVHDVLLIHYTNYS